MFNIFFRFKTLKYIFNPQFNFLMNLKIKYCWKLIIIPTLWWIFFYIKNITNKWDVTEVTKNKLRKIFHIKGFTFKNCFEKKSIFFSENVFIFFLRCFIWKKPLKEMNVSFHLARHVRFMWIFLNGICHNFFFMR